MAANLFYEAKGEGKKGMQAVAAVTHNRVRHKNYPKSICAVVFQQHQFSWTKQYSYAQILKVLDGDLSDYSDKDLRRYQEAWKIAQTKPKDYLQGALHFHAVYVNPKWASYKVKVKTIGQHVFYKDPTKHSGKG